MKFLPLVIQSLIFFVSVKANVFLQGFDKDVIQPMDGYHRHQLRHRHLDPSPPVIDYMDWYYCGWETETNPDGYWPWNYPECMSQQYGKNGWEFLVNAGGTDDDGNGLIIDCTIPRSKILMSVFHLNGYFGGGDCDDLTEPDCVCNLDDDVTSCDDITNSCDAPSDHRKPCCIPPGRTGLGTCRTYFDIAKATDPNIEGSLGWEMKYYSFGHIFVDGIEQDTVFFDNTIYTLNPPCSLSGIGVQVGKEASIIGIFAVLGPLSKGIHVISGDGGLLNPDDPNGDPSWSFDFQTNLEVV